MLALEPSDLEPRDITRILFGANVLYVLKRRDIGFVLVSAAIVIELWMGKLWNKILPQNLS
jgi:hypothetical protein